MLVALIPTSFHDFASVRLVLLYCGISQQPDVVVHVEIEKWTRLSPRLVHDEVVESVVLCKGEHLIQERKFKYHT